MFIVTTREQMRKAIERAKALHPKVRVCSFGEYEVTGSSGNNYSVKCYRDERNQKVVECGCPTKDGVPCKHGVAALPVHIHLATQRISRASR